VRSRDRTGSKGRKKRFVISNANHDLSNKKEIMGADIDFSPNHEVTSALNQDDELFIGDFEDIQVDEYSEESEEELFEIEFLKIKQVQS
jgi:hypothetical protein